MRTIRIGIDVGGTFTHAVALETRSFGLVAQTKTATTHRHEEGVAAGVINALLKLLQKGRIAPEEVVLVAHSTTQAANALLEGDVAKVGIIGIGRGLKSFRLRRHSPVNDFALAPGKLLRTCYRFLDARGEFTDDAIAATLRALQAEGATAFVAAAFSRAHIAHEQRVAARARALGLPAISTQQVSPSHDLRLRTRTAVIHAGILPVMIATADLLEKSVRALGLTAPLMVMRSDGGLMDLKSVRERPLLTALSGPAAGVAAALIYAKISDGVFVEVGGTSTHICMIRRGQVLMRTAHVGQYPVHTRTLEVRTVGVGGGSMPRVQNHEIVAVGPRSAHMAGMPYESFCQIQDLENAEPIFGAPEAEDPRDYVFLQKHDKNFAITVTGAANYLKLVPEYDYAHGGEKNGARAFEKLGELVQRHPQDLARDILEKASEPVMSAINALAKSHGLNPGAVKLIGGGGGASALLPFIAEKTKQPVELVKHSAVISAMGVALAMVRETIEREMAEPTAENLMSIHREAEAAVIAMGAAPETVEVKLEVEARGQRVTATALGSADVGFAEKLGKPLPANKRAAAAAAALETDKREIVMLAQAGFFSVYAAHKQTKKFFGLIKIKSRPAVIVDQHGVVRRRCEQAVLEETTAGETLVTLRRLLPARTRSGNLPEVHLAVGSRLIDFSGLINARQVLALGEHELGKFAPETPVLVLAAKKV